MYTVLNCFTNHTLTDTNYTIIARKRPSTIIVVIAESAYTQTNSIWGRLHGQETTKRKMLSVRTDQGFLSKSASQKSEKLPKINLEGPLSCMYSK